MRNIALWYRPNEITKKDYLRFDDTKWLQRVYVSKSEFDRLENGEITLDDLIDEEELMIEEVYIDFEF